MRRRRIGFPNSYSRRVVHIFFQLYMYISTGVLVLRVLVLVLWVHGSSTRWEEDDNDLRLMLDTATRLVDKASY